MSDCSLAHSDAAYILGSLSPADRLEFERHLPGCERCRRSVAELAGLPGLLGRVPREQVEAPLPFDPLPETVLPALVAAVRREQRRKTVLVTVGAAAAVAVVALGATALQSARDDGPDPGVAPPAATSAAPTLAPALPMEVVGDDWGVRAEVSLTPVQWGTKVSLSCSYQDNDSGSGHAYGYRLVAVMRHGEPVELMTWEARPGDVMEDERTTTQVHLEEMKAVEVRNDYGGTLLRVNL